MNDDLEDTAFVKDSDMISVRTVNDRVRFRTWHAGRVEQAFVLRRTQRHHLVDHHLQQKKKKKKSKQCHRWDFTKKIRVILPARALGGQAHV